MRKFLLSCLLAGFVAACGTVPTEPDPDQAAAAENAREAMQAGNYRAAAGEFEALAANSRGPLAERYRLSAAEAYLRADSVDEARRLGDGLTFDAEESPLLFVRERLLAAELALLAGDTAAAAERLENAYPPAGEARLRGEYHLLRARIMEREDRPVAAASERLAADSALGDLPQRRQHTEQLWQQLRQLDTGDLNRLRDDARDSAAGWIDLALIERADLSNAANLRRTLDDWQLTYPNHPGAVEVVPALREFAAGLDETPQQIAVLLPLSSGYAEAARIIRDGLIAGWQQDTGERPLLRFYDVGSDDVVDVYRQAVTEGADRVIGPLRKESVTRLIEEADISVPTLALNYYEGDPAKVEAINSTGRLPRLYQFSLAPEDEARQLARRAWIDGHARALALTPANDWGDRIYQAFLQEFRALGGDVLERVNYSTDDQAFSAAVQALLNIDESERRSKALRAQLRRSIESEPRRRRDAGFIMIAGYPAAGRQIGPQLQYHRARDLPVYATSHIFDGTSNSADDADMNGFRFPDMPWLLDSSHRQSSLHRQISRSWPDRMHNNPRLYAFGIDTYRVLSQLSHMAMDQNRQFSGVSGRLTVGPSGQIQRQLSWAQFVDGVPQPLSPASLDNGRMVQQQ